MGNSSADNNLKETSSNKKQEIEQQLNERCSIIASEDTWMEGKAKSQLKFVSQMPDMLRVAGMPDLHPGIDAPIGAAFLSENRIYPSLVGSDIGCGIALWETELPTHKVNINKLTRKLGNIDKGLNGTWSELISERKNELGLVHTEFDGSLGTIGGGNHFAEITLLDKVYGDFAEELNLRSNKVHLLVHSGSRGLGTDIFRTHAFKAGHLGIAYPSTAAEAYLIDHETAVKYAYLNRELIARRMMDQLGTSGTEILSVHHNLVEKMPKSNEVNGSATDDGTQFLHRKGAAPSNQGLVVIAGNRGDFSYLVKPKASMKSLYSIAHGAGRKWSRGQCKAKLEKRYAHWRDLERTQFGGKVICENKNLAYEEAPEAYKSIATIIESLLEAHLIEVVARLRPIITYKTQEKG